MSRILYVSDDDRDIPAEARWWRIRLPRWCTNADGNTMVMQTSVGNTFAEGDWWAAHLDYFDGRTDWSWPYDVRHAWEWDSYTAIMEVLDVVPASPPVVPGSGIWRCGGRWALAEVNGYSFNMEAASFTVRAEGVA